MKYFASPNVWVGIATICAFLGIVFIAFGLLSHFRPIVIAGIALLVPLFFLAIVLVVFVIPFLAIKSRARKGKNEDQSEKGTAWRSGTGIE